MFGAIAATAAVVAASDIEEKRPAFAKSIPGVFVLGQRRSGKTSFVAALKGKGFDERTSFADSNLALEADRVIVPIREPGEFMELMPQVFLRKNSIYALCFGMQWLRPEASPELKMKCLAYLRAILNLIQPYTFYSSTERTAIFLIGTHCDMVEDPRDHAAISQLLLTEFESHYCWPFVQLMRTLFTPLFFYPVSNLVKDRPATQLFTADISRISNEYSRPRVLPAWERFVDALQPQALTSPILTLQEASRLACDQCGVQSEDVANMLTFLHSISRIAWIDIPALREHIIIDIVAFYKPVAFLIHMGSEYDDYLAPSHMTYRECMRKNHRYSTELRNKGILHTELLETLWRDFQLERDSLLALMVQFGLLEPIIDDDDADVSSRKRYIVPALLPRSDPAQLKPGVLWGSDAPVRTSYLAFTSDDHSSESWIDNRGMTQMGHLSKLFFFRLLCKCINWATIISKDNTLDLRGMTLCADLVLLCFGNLLFSMVPLYDLSCIRVEMPRAGSNSLSVMKKLQKFCQQIALEMSVSLHAFAAIPHRNELAVDSSQNAVDGFELGLKSYSLLRLDALQKAADDYVPVKLYTSILVSCDNLFNDPEYMCWLNLRRMVENDQYDVFLSYRPFNDRVNRPGDSFDHELVLSVFESLDFLSIGDTHRSIDVFLDSERLPVGKKFDAVVIKALINSSVVVPVCSHYALQLMLKHNPSTVDNVLLEWMLAVECEKAKVGGRVKFVFPILVGEISSSNIPGNIFDSKVLRNLPDVVPAATITRCRQSLLENNFQPSKDLDTYTVSSLIKELFSFKGLLLSEYKPHQFLPRIVVQIVSLTIKADYSKQTANVVATATAADEKKSSIVREIWDIMLDPTMCTDFVSLEAHIKKLKLESTEDLFALANAPKHIDKLLRFAKPASRLKLQTLFSRLRESGAGSYTVNVHAFDLQEARKEGKGLWQRSKVMFIGQGESGKTSFMKNVLGESFVGNKPSTAGMEAFSCSLNHISAGQSTGSGVVNWAECGAGDEYARALAKNISEQRNGINKENEAQLLDCFGKSSASLSTSTSTSTSAGASAAASVATGSADASATKSGVPIGTAAATVAAPSSNSTAVVSTPAKEPVLTLTSAAAGGSKGNDKGDIDDGDSDTDSDADDAKKKKKKSIKDDVAKYLATEVTDSGLKISLFDYGGQDVFDAMHQLFLTKYGVYVLCFNMEKLLPGALERESSECIRHIRKWLNSIYIHTCDDTDEDRDGNKTYTAAHFVLIGTHGDTVPDPDIHASISKKLKDSFYKHPAWSSRLKNVSTDADGKQVERERLCFYPVSNVAGRAACQNTRNVMSIIQKSIESEKYVNTRIDLTWLSTMDALTELDKKYITLDELNLVASTNCKVPLEQVPVMLSFLRKMGWLLWIDDVKLRDMVILDPIAFFVKPATLIVCDHGMVDDAGDHVMNHVPIDLLEACEDCHPLEWRNLLDKGILHTALLETLWRDFKQERDSLLALMVQFGLLEPIIDDDDADVSSRKRYFVPALLPRSDPAQLKPGVIWGSDASCGKIRTIHTYFLYFSLLNRNETGKKIWLTKSDVFDGFMPSGLFERLEARCIRWAAAIAKNGRTSLDSTNLYRDMIVMAIGAHTFSIVPHFELNCLRIEIEGDAPFFVADRLGEICTEVMRECMPNLRLFEAVSLRDDLYADLRDTINRGEREVVVSRAQRTITDNEPLLLISLEELQSYAEQGTDVKRGAEIILSATDIKRRYRCWLPEDGPKTFYDVFFSYRHTTSKGSEHDQKLVSGLFDHLGFFQVSADGFNKRGMDVFLDRKRLQKGKHFDEEFSDALIRSKVVVPICSHYALKRMAAKYKVVDAQGVEHEKEFDPLVPDNVLLEWMIAVECQKANSKAAVAATAVGAAAVCKSHVQYVFPLLFGESATGDFFESKVDLKDRVLKNLSSARPIATINKCREFLEKNGIRPSEELNTYTVSDFLNARWITLNAFEAHKSPSRRHIREISETIVKSVNAALQCISRAVITTTEDCRCAVQQQGDEANESRGNATLTLKTGGGVGVGVGIAGVNWLQDLFNDDVVNSRLGKDNVNRLHGWFTAEAGDTKENACTALTVGLISIPDIKQASKEAGLSGPQIVRLFEAMGLKR